MGMAASQARYLELTARKTNVEYAGQQVNQQRTELANESAGMFSQLMSLQVPTAPSSNDYTTTNYKFNDGENDCTISSVQGLAGDPNYNSTVQYYYTTTVDKGISKTRTDLGAVGAGTVANPYWLTDGTTTKQTKLTQCSLTDTDATKDQASLLQICKDNPTSALATDLGYSSTTGTIDTTKLGSAYKYTSASGNVNYYSNTALAAAILATTSGTPPVQTGAATSLTSYYAADIEQKTSKTEKAYVSKEADGRYSAIQLASESGTTLPLTATSTTDQNAYNDAMNEYTYQQQSYEQQVTSINAKTEVIQQEDRTLELKLKQLDTEQQALSTEMDAVKKVIDKNIESTFKTFSS